MTAVLRNVNMREVIAKNYLRDVEFVEPLKTHITTLGTVDSLVKRCWFCRRVIHGEVQKLPISYQPPNNFEYIKNSQFHGVRCMLAYIDDRKAFDPELKDSDTLITLLLSRGSDEDILQVNDTITPVASWKVLQEYGGREHGQSYDTIAKSVKLPLMVRSTMKSVSEQFLLVYNAV